MKHAYLAESKRPIAALWIVGTLVLAYELGSRLLAHGRPTWRIVAYSMIEWAYTHLGVSRTVGEWIPPLAVLATLTAVQIASRQSWSIRPRYLGGVTVEGIAFALPLVVLGAVFVRFLPLGSGPSGAIVASIGAGVYEEFVFRLLLLALGHLLLVDLLKAKEFAANVSLILVSAGLFSAYHYLGPERFSASVFAFRTAAGIHFGTLMLTRGFAVTVCSHVAYDILVTLLSGSIV